MKFNMKKGFTLIELLVVITIISILATGATTVYTSQIQKARDSTRITDLKALQSAVEQVYQDTAEYPRSRQIVDESKNDNILAYLPVIPGDAKNGQTCASSDSNSQTYCGYAYKPAADDNGIQFGSYELSTAFENEGNLNNKANNANDNGNDADRLEIGLRQGAIDTSVKAATLNGNNIQGACAPGGTADPTSDTDTIIIHKNPASATDLCS